jgi:hypothetical protein
LNAYQKDQYNLAKEIESYETLLKQKKAQKDVTDAKIYNITLSINASNKRIKDINGNSYNINNNQYKQNLDDL